VLILVSFLPLSLYAGRVGVKARGSFRLLLAGDSFCAVLFLFVNSWYRRTRGGETFRGDGDVSLYGE
jgi:hypothetical protein